MGKPKSARDTVRTKKKYCFNKYMEVRPLRKNAKQPLNLILFILAKEQIFKISFTLTLAI